MNRDLKFQMGTAAIVAVIVFCLSFVSGIYNRVRALELQAGTLVSDFLGGQPVWPKSLKVLVYDDKAAAISGKAFLDEQEWADVINLIARQKPRRIIIDKIFSVLTSSERSGLPRLKEAMGSAGNVWTGLKLVGASLPTQPPMSLIENPEKLIFSHSPNRSNIDVRYVYGPMAELQDAVRGSGHLSYAGGGSSSMLAFLPEQQDKSLVIGHLALAAADSVRLQDGELNVDGFKLTRDLNGNTPTFLNMKFFKKHMTTMAGVLQRLANKNGIPDPLDYINAGDTVLILPLTFTGNTDMDHSLFNGTPKGYILASLVRSVVAKDWLFHSRINILNLISLIMLGVFWGLGSPRKKWLVGTVTMFVGLCAVALFNFAVLSVDTDWIILSSAFLAPAVIVHVRRLRSDLQATISTMNTLSRALPPKLKRDLLANPELLVRQPSEKIVTLMFVDIVNFSIYAQSHQPKEVFETLKEHLMEMTDIITKNHGVVDKTLGDGLLAIFGYDFTGREAATNQADAAIKAAKEIQICNNKRCVEATAAGQVALPLRIGINTAAVYLGDLDGVNRFDFTVIGHGVNFTQRLENACDTGGILVSNTTYEVSNYFRSLPGNFVRRLISIKHHDELFDVYFCDPLHDDPVLKKSFGEAIRAGHCIDRSEKRIPIGDNEPLFAEIESIGAVQITDYSRSGCCLFSKKFLSRGIKVRLTIKFGDENKSVFAEVRWAFQHSDQKYMHGLKFINASEQDLEEIYRQFAQQSIGLRSVA